MSRILDVYWCSIAGKEYRISDNEMFQYSMYFEPEPVLKHITETRDKDLFYLNCPAIKDYYKNTFVIRSPIDITFEVVDNEGFRFVKTHNYDQKFFDNFVSSRFEENASLPMLSLEMANFIFYSDQSVMIEQLNASMSMHKYPFLQKIMVLNGTFDISKWIRPVTFSFEVVAKNAMVSIKRGDPLYYIRFNTDKAVRLHRVEFSQDLRKITDSCLDVKRYMKGNSMKQNYELSKTPLSLWGSSLFKKKSKCPFSGWFK